jgi:hypothetical protein
MALDMIQRPSVASASSSALLRANVEFTSPIIGTKASSKAAAGWSWLQTLVENEALRGVPIEKAKLSALVTSFSLCRRQASGEAFMSLGAAEWAVLGWPLKQTSVGDYVFDGTVGLTWYHITDLDVWHVLLWEPQLVQDSLIVIRPTSEPMHLLEHPLAHSQTHALSISALRFGAIELGLQVDQKLSREELLRLLASHFGKDAAKVIEKDVSPQKAAALLVKDPFVEGVLTELPSDDRLEYQEVEEQLKRHKVRQRVAKWQSDKAAAKKRQTPKAQPKRKGAGRGRGVGKRRRVEAAPGEGSGIGRLDYVLHVRLGRGPLGRCGRQESAAGWGGGSGSMCGAIGVRLLAKHARLTRSVDSHRCFVGSGRASRC